MEALLFILCIIILVVLFSMKSEVSKHLISLREKINDLERQLKQSPYSKSESDEKREAMEEYFKQKKPVTEPEPLTSKIETPKVELPKVEPPKIETAFPPISKVKEELEASLEEKIEEEVEEEVKDTVLQTHYVNQPPPPPKPGFFERNPDMEKFIGENLSNKIGIGILVLGIGFFVKYAIDQDWINEFGRVAIGVVCGGALLALAHYLREKFTAFSSVLVGGGIAVLYLTITIAFQEYQIFSQTAAFIIMIGITAFAVALSLGYNKIELAVVAILGGYGSPFMVSTGEGNYVVLFTYILILNVGMLVLAYYKKWNLVNIICYAFTVILFGSWLSAKFDGNNIGMVNGALFFSTAFYLIFFAMNLINNLKENKPFKSLDFTLLLSNTFFYYSAGMYILSYDFGFAYRGLFTILLAVFNFGFAFSLYKNQKVDRNLVFLLIGLVLTFISLAAPVQLEGNYITMFWSAEAVLLLWLSQKSGIKLMKIGSIIMNVLMLISLLMDWGQLYFDYSYKTMNVVFNKAYITGLFSLASFILTFFLLKKEKEDFVVNVQLYKTVLTIVAIVTCYFGNLFELQYQLNAYEISGGAFNIFTGIYNMVFILALVIGERFLLLPNKVRQAFAAWGPVAVFSYILFYHSPIIEARYSYLVDGLSNTGFFWHYILVALLLPICILSIRLFRKLQAFNKDTHQAYSWFFVSFFVFIASIELDHLVALIAYQSSGSLDLILEQNHKIGWPILWGVGAFIIIFVGLKQKLRHLRIISLVLFLITLLKLFLFDIQGISEGGKIAAFISLGILLLVISFMYQRLKKILLADEPVASSSENTPPENRLP